MKDPITVTPATTVRELIEITKANNVSGVPVVQDGKEKHKNLNYKVKKNKQTVFVKKF